MTTAVREYVRVLAGGRIEIQSDELPVGAEAEVIVVIDAPARRRNLVDFIGAGRGCFATPEEVDAFIRQERDRWE
jgi:hypothetical protein